MHPNRTFRWTDRGSMMEFVEEVSFCTIFLGGNSILHAPVATYGDDVLRFHAARSNRATNYPKEPKAIVSCIGAHGYISPDWSGAVDRVPTWNYIAVEIQGSIRELSRIELELLLDDLSTRHEIRLAPKPIWTRDKMTPGSFEKMLNSLVGYEVTVDEMRGTRKLGAAGLTPEKELIINELSPHNPALAELMRHDGER